LSPLLRIGGFLVAAMLLALPVSAAGPCTFAYCGRNPSAMCLGTTCTLANDTGRDGSRCLSASAPARILIANDLKISRLGVQSTSVALPTPAFIPKSVGITARAPIQKSSGSRLLALHCTFLI
jgi:hypothetical protein